MNYMYIMLYIYTMYTSLVEKLAQIKQVAFCSANSHSAKYSDGRVEQIAMHKSTNVCSPKSQLVALSARTLITFGKGRSGNMKAACAADVSSAETRLASSLSNSAQAERKDASRCWLRPKSSSNPF